MRQCLSHQPTFWRPVRNILPFVIRDRWLGVIGIVVGILGIAASVYAYFASQRQRRPTFVDDPDRTVIVARQNVSSAPIRVIRSDGSPVLSDVVSARFYFWNDGNESIRHENVLAPLRVTLAGRTARILDYKLIRATRSVCGIGLIPDSPTTLRVDFRILEPGDGFTAQIIFEGDRNAQMGIAGIIEGAVLITTSDLASRRIVLKAIESPIGISALLALLVVSLSPYYLLRLYGRGSFETEKRAKQFRRMVMVAQATLMVIVIAIDALLVFYVLPRAQQDARRTVVQRVPESVLPPLPRRGA